MKLALSGRSALIAWRALRADSSFDPAALEYGPLPQPDPSPAQRLTASVMRSAAGAYYQQGTLSVAVPDAASRIRTADVDCVVHAHLPEDSYWHMGGGLYLPRPELLFVEMAAALSPLSQLMLGMELCGGYARPDSYLIPVAMTPASTDEYLSRLSRIDGLVQSRSVAKRLIGGAWSPMEAVVAHLLRMPFEELGYGFGRIVLNPRIATDDGAERIPDILIEGSSIGINYEGTEHFDVGSVANAAFETAMNPGSANGQTALDQAAGQLRAGYVGDVRRNADLMAEGYTVFSVTKEDLYERGGLDRVVRKVLRAMEREGMRGIGKRRELLNNGPLASERQLRIWSLLPGATGERARKKLGKRYDDMLARDSYVTDVLMEGDTFTEIGRRSVSGEETVYI